MIGTKHGRLTVLAKAPSDPKWGMSRWVCECECGATITTFGRTLRNAKCPSCGCAHAEAVSEAAKKYNCVDDYLGNTTPNGDCMEWAGHTDRNGYGSVGSYTPKHMEKRTSLVHRRVFAMVHGYLPTIVMHSCDNPKCVNPDHLVAGDHKANSQDAVRKGRLNKGREKYWVLHEGRRVGLAEYSKLTSTPMATLQWRARNGKLELIR